MKRNPKQACNHPLATQLLAGAFRSRGVIDGLPEAATPRTIDDAYAIQDRLARATGLATIGWKVGMTTESARKAGGMPEPMVGRLFGEYDWETGASIENVALWKPGIELEFAFVIATPPREPGRPLDRDQAAASVERCFLAFEIIGSRFADRSRWAPLGNLADNAGGLGFVRGPQVAHWRELDFPSIRCEARAEGELFSPSLTGAERSHPLDVLGWFYGFAARRGIRIAPGTIVSTGTCNLPKPIPLGKVIVGSFAGVGEMSCTIGS